MVLDEGLRSTEGIREAGHDLIDLGQVCGPHDAGGHNGVLLEQAHGVSDQLRDRLGSALVEVDDVERHVAGATLERDVVDGVPAQHILAAPVDEAAEPRDASPSLACCAALHISRAENDIRPAAASEFIQTLGDKAVAGLDYVLGLEP